MKRNERDNINRRYYQGLPDHMKVAAKVGQIRDLAAKPWNLWSDDRLMKALAAIDRWVKDKEKEYQERLQKQAEHDVTSG